LTSSLLEERQKGQKDIQSQEAWGDVEELPKLSETLRSATKDFEHSEQWLKKAVPAENDDWQELAEALGPYQALLEEIRLQCRTRPESWIPGDYSKGFSSPIPNSRPIRDYGAYFIVNSMIETVVTRTYLLPIYREGIRTGIFTDSQLEALAEHFYPGAVISHRSALEGTLSPRGKLHISLPQKVAPVRQLPGLEIRIWEGPEAQVNDVRTTIQEDGNGLYMAMAGSHDSE
jgi:hypothetical protein